MYVYMLVMLLINISVLFEEIRIVFKTKSIESFEIDTDFLIHCCFNKYTSIQLKMVRFLFASKIINKNN